MAPAPPLVCSRMPRALAILAAACASVALIGALHTVQDALAGGGPSSPRRTSISRELLALGADSGSCAVSVQQQFNCSEPACADLQEAAGGYINYLMAEECMMRDAKWLGWVLIGTWGLFLIYMLGDTADVFLCPTLDTIVDIWDIDPNIAGARGDGMEARLGRSRDCAPNRCSLAPRAGLTFLALANGASDVAAAVASFLSGVGQVGISAILGAGAMLRVQAGSKCLTRARRATLPHCTRALAPAVRAGVFVTTLVVGAVSLVGEVRVDRRPFLRDAGFNVLAILYLYYVFEDGEVHLIEVHALRLGQ